MYQQTVEMKMYIQTDLYKACEKAHIVTYVVSICIGLSDWQKILSE